jgi:predicted Zn-dependent peptidase
VDEKIFQRVKKSSYGDILRKLNNFDATCYAYAYGYFNGYDEFDTAAVLDSITIDDVNAFVRSSLCPDNMAISIINPKN